MAGRLDRILIADDHELVRKGIGGLLQGRASWRIVAEASNGRDALAAARDTRPHIAILDYSLPLINGLELTRLLKQELPDIEILIFTMHDREQLVTDLLRAGVRGYVLKSDGGVELCAAVEALSLRKAYFSAAIAEMLIDEFVASSGITGRTTILTPREREVVQLIAEGKINKQIAYLLGVSTKTVETHRAAAMHKLAFSTTAELVRYAVRNNIVQA